MSHCSNIAVRVRSTENGKQRESFEADVHDAPARMVLPRNSDITEGDGSERTNPAGELSPLRVTEGHFRDAPWSNGLLDHTEVPLGGDRKVSRRVPEDSREHRHQNRPSRASRVKRGRHVVPR